MEINKNSTKKYNEVILEKLFFGKITCFKLQMNMKKEIYFHIGLRNDKSNNWKWTKVKMSDVELGKIYSTLCKDISNCNFFHKYEESSTQIWCNKKNDKFTIKINEVSKNFVEGEIPVLKIILKECIIRSNFNY